jgi:hypothetical protein
MPGSVRKWTLVALMERRPCTSSFWRQLVEWSEQVITWRDLRGHVYSYSDIVCLLIQWNFTELPSIHILIWLPDFSITMPGFGPSSDDSNQTLNRAFRAVSGHVFFFRKEKLFVAARILWSCHSRLPVTNRTDLIFFGIFVAPPPTPEIV